MELYILNNNFLIRISRSC